MNTVRDSFLIILTAVLLCVAAPRLQAETLNRCQRRVVHAEHISLPPYVVGPSFLYLESMCENLKPHTLTKLQQCYVILKIAHDGSN